MALKIRATPTVHGESAQRILDAINTNNKAQATLSPEELAKRKESLEKVFQKAKT